jgi:hypothetical protein
LNDFSNASFPPETIGTMKDAMDAAVATLPDPVSSAHIQAIAETILRSQNWRERPRYLAKNGANRIADYATRLMVMR